MYIYLYICIYINIYIYRYVGGRRPVCSVYIGVYIGIYISTFNGQRKEARVQCALICTAADGSHCIPTYIPIYTNISVYRGRRRLCAVCTPISAADGSRHRYIHRYMPIHYIRRRVFSAHSSTPPLTAAGIPIYTPIYIDISAGVC